MTKKQMEITLRGMTTLRNEYTDKINELLNIRNNCTKSVDNMIKLSKKYEKVISDLGAYCDDSETNELNAFCEEYASLNGQLKNLRKDYQKITNKLASIYEQRNELDEQITSICDEYKIDQKKIIS